jgi:hypothetical protein
LLLRSRVDFLEEAFIIGVIFKFYRSLPVYMRIKRGSAQEALVKDYIDSRRFSRCSMLVTIVRQGSIRETLLARRDVGKKRARGDN